ncbi:TPA: hypothetical protein DEF17_04325 [bacterium]|nr:hypothetical protein [bacterium]
MTLRRKLTWMITLIVVLILVTNMIVVRYEYSRTLADSFERRMNTIGTTVGLMVLPALVVSGGDIDERLADVNAVLRKTVESQDDILEISVFDQKWAPLISYPPACMFDSNDNQIERVVPLKLTAEGRDYGYIKVNFNLTRYLKDQRDILLRQVSVGVIFSLIGLIAAWLVASTITKPLEHLRDTANDFGKKNFKARTSINSNDEIGMLAGTFNDMASKIENQIAVITQLQEWGRIISSELARDKVIQIVVEAFIEMGNVSKMSLMLWNESTECLEIVGGVGLRQDAASFLKLKIGEGVAGKVMATGKPIKVDKLKDSSEYKSFSGEHRAKESLFALPLIAKGRCFGVVNLHEKNDGSSFDEEDESALTTLAEISSVAFENSRLYDLAITDGLTRLFIARYFHQRMEEEIIRTKRTGTPLSLLMADIDHFKDINDTYGHQVGDAVLVMLSRIFRRVFREIDIPCRYGGEEFTVILPNTDKQGSVIVAERMRKAVEDFTFTTSAGKLHVTISMGLSTYKLGRSKDEMINESDAAMYNSKRSGRNRVTHFLDVTEKTL